MKPERSFVAERAVAQHCAALLPARQAGSADALARFAALGERLARALATGFAPLLGDCPPCVSAALPEEATPSALAVTIPQLAASSLLSAGSQQAPVLVSLGGAAVLQLVDRAFGGKGEATVPLPTSFPLSAELMITRIEAVLVAAMTRALGEGTALSPVRRSASLAELAPFAADLPLAVLTLEIGETEGAPWRLVIAVPVSMLDALLGRGEAPGHSRPARAAHPSPVDAPFADMPLTLSAVLVDMRMAMSALSKLEVGQIIPVAVARAVPMRISGQTIAHGTVGALDDRVAIQITQAF